MSRWLMHLACLISAALIPFGAFGQSWPSRPLNIVVGYAPGGPVDIVARHVAKALGDQLGQTVIVDNKPGAGATIAAAAVARANPDGYTMLLVVPGLTAAETLYKSRRYELGRDFAPISLVGMSPNWLLTPADSPFKNVQDMVRITSANPGKYSYAHGSKGGLSNLTAELMKMRRNLDIVEVGYRGNGPALTDLVAGREQLMIDQPISSESFVKSGQLRPLAVMSATRLPNYPDVPTMQESGFANFVIDVWYGLMFPARTPEAIVQQTRAALTKALAQPEVVANLEHAGVTPRTGTPKELEDLVTQGIAQWKTIIESNHMGVQ